MGEIKWWEGRLVGRSHIQESTYLMGCYDDEGDGGFSANE